MKYLKHVLVQAVSHLLNPPNPLTQGHMGQTPCRVQGGDLPHGNTIKMVQELYVGNKELKST